MIQVVEDIPSRKADVEPHLRPFRPEDIPDLLDLYMEAYREHPEYGEASRQKARRYLNWLRRHSTFFQVAEVNGRLAGFVVVDTNWRDEYGERVGEIHEIAVHPDFWGKGVGARLLEAALAFIRKQGLKRARLWVGEDNWRARQFYRRYGFRETGSGWGTWVRMVKRV